MPPPLLLLKENKRLFTVHLNKSILGISRCNYESPHVIGLPLGVTRIVCKRKPPRGLATVLVRPRFLLLTLRIATIAAEVAAAGVFKLAVAFGADADHVGHDGAYGRRVLRAEY